MGAACTACTNKNSYEGIYKDFWSGIGIRTMPQKDWTEVAKNKLNPKLKEINEKNWLIIINNNLSWEENKELSKNVFTAAMKLSEERGGQYLLLLSLLFLCPKNSLNTKQQFEDLAKVVFQMKEDFKEENHVLYIKHKLLYKVVAFYVNFISFFCADKLSAFAANKKDFEEAMASIFSPEVQEAFLKEEIFTGITDEWQNFDGFFEVVYPLLQNDGKVRESLSFFYDLKSKKAKKTDK